MLKRLDYSLCSGFASLKKCGSCKRYTAHYDFNGDGQYSFIPRGESPRQDCPNYMPLKEKK
jgi:hypothetical protein